MTSNRKTEGKTWGGKRSGAGRKQGSGMYGEPTTAVRVPTRLVEKLPDLIKTLDSEAVNPQNELMDLLSDFLNKWDGLTNCSNSEKNHYKRLARDMWSELESILKSVQESKDA